MVVDCIELFLLPLPVKRGDLIYVWMILIHEEHDLLPNLRLLRRACAMRHLRNLAGTFLTVVCIIL